MEFKGTKSNWHVLKIDLSDYKSISIGNPINNKVICHMVLGGAINNTDEYNSLLISKAPEMLEMLKWLHDKLGTAFETEKSEIKQLIKEATEL